MILDDFPRLALPNLTGDLTTDVGALLKANGKARTYRHVLDVVQANAEIAAQYNLDATACRTAALLHDIAAIIPPADMLSWADAHGLDTCEAERRHPFLLHQRFSRMIATDRFGAADDIVLSAIECHTTLREEAGPCEMALFIADKLAWDQEGAPPFFDAVSAALKRSLPAACLVYMNYMTDNGLLLCPHVSWTAAQRWLKNSI